MGELVFFSEGEAGVEAERLTGTGQRMTPMAERSGQPSLGWVLLDAETGDVFDKMGVLPDTFADRVLPQRKATARTLWHILAAARRIEEHVAKIKPLREAVEVAQRELTHREHALQAEEDALLRAKAVLCRLAGIPE